jgi:hypothetical protein
LLRARFTASTLSLRERISSNKKTPITLQQWGFCYWWRRRAVLGLLSSTAPAHPCALGSTTTRYAGSPPSS